MLNILLILLGKTIISFSKLANIGSGSTWPGHIALTLNGKFIKNIISKNKRLKIILIAGTNGKTTTGKLLKTILEENKSKVFQNEGGANLLNGIASSLALNSNFTGKINYDYAIFEVDENAFPLTLKEVEANFIVTLNLFRDQLDRYGEINIVAEKWNKALAKISLETTLVLNADDPLIAFLAKNTKAKHVFFGVSDFAGKKTEHASDSTRCPFCGNKLNYKNITFSHLGEWKCDNCGLKKPTPDITSFEVYPLPGLYNKYNVNAAVLTARNLGVSDITIKKALKKFKPAFGRQEIIKFNNKNIQLFLSKNPASFNQSLDTINSLSAKNLLIVLNDRIPDGRDVSWIWDVDFEKKLDKFKRISISGDRPYDMALRLKYSIDSNKVQIYENIKNALISEAKRTKKNETLFILPTYSAMLELRKILTGKKIL